MREVHFMTAFNGLNNNSDQSININWFRDSNLRPGETGNSIVMFAGNDTVMIRYMAVQVMIH